MQRFILLLAALLLAAAPLFAEVKLEIGPGTTVIDGPVNPDGTINYLAYLNEKLSEGVTPENNFAVDVAMVMPESRWPSPAFREKVFKGLGVENPADGPYITRIRDVIGDGESVDFEDRRYQSWLDLISRPWTAEDHPEVKQWLDSQNEALDRIQIVVGEKGRYYFPLVIKEGVLDSFDNALLPWLATLRTCARGFQARAELKIGLGDLDGAWSDVKAMQQLANLSMQEPFQVSWLVGVSIHSMAVSVIDDIPDSDTLTSDLAKQIIVEAHQNSRLKPLTDGFDLCERFNSLDMIVQYWKGRGDQFSYQVLPKNIYILMETEEYDPNVTMRAVNDWIDLWVQLVEIEDYHERIAKATQYERVNEMLYNRAMKLLGGDADTRRLMRREIAESNMTTAAVTPIFASYTLPVSEVFRSEAKIKMRLALAPVALAIGGYHAENGAYPPDLHALVPAYLDSLPTDFATGELPVYKVEDGAAVVYSLGTDLEDDGGVDDLNEGDIVFRIQR